MSDQQQKKFDRPPRFGGKQQQQQGNKSSNRHPTTSRKQHTNVTKNQHHRPSTQDKVRYAVIITNVENDFGKLHSASLPYYCGLRPDYEETLDVERLVNTGGPEVQKLVAAQRGCGYSVRCRTETRSAEIGFYGPANADFTPMQLQKQPRPVRDSGVVPSKAYNTNSPTVAGSSMHRAGSDEADPTVPNSVGEGEESSTEKTIEAGTQVTPPITAEVPTNALEALALRLRRMRYFEDKIPVHVHLPGHAAGEVLLRVGADPKTTAPTAAVAAMIGEKRAREEKTENEKGEDKEDDGCDDASSGSENIRLGGAKPHKATGTVLKQFPNRQKDFVTAVAALSTHTPLRVVRRKLHDLPGYMSCWSLYEKHLRVVFRDAESLFKAKQLLDQFELDAGLRVSLMLSDVLSRSHADFLRAQEAGEAD